MAITHNAPCIATRLGLAKDKAVSFCVALLNRLFSKSKPSAQVEAMRCYAPVSPLSDGTSLSVDTKVSTFLNWFWSCLCKPCRKLYDVLCRVESEWSDNTRFWIGLSAGALVVAGLNWLLWHLQLVRL